MISAWAEREKGCLTSPWQVAGRGEGGLELGEQRRWRSVRRMGKERTERLLSKAEEAHSRRIKKMSESIPSSSLHFLFP